MAATDGLLVALFFVAATNASSQRRGESVPGPYNPVCFGCSIPPGKMADRSSAVPGSSTISVNFYRLRLFFFCRVDKSTKNCKTSPRLANIFRIQRQRRRGDIAVLSLRRIGSSRVVDSLLVSRLLFNFVAIFLSLYLPIKRNKRQSVLLFSHFVLWGKGKVCKQRGDLSPMRPCVIDAEWGSNYSRTMCIVGQRLSVAILFFSKWKDLLRIKSILFFGPLCIV